MLSTVNKATEVLYLNCKCMVLCFETEIGSSDTNPSNTSTDLDICLSHWVGRKSFKLGLHWLFYRKKMITGVYKAFTAKWNEHKVGWRSCSSHMFKSLGICKSRIFYFSVVLNFIFPSELNVDAALRSSFLLLLVLVVSLSFYGSCLQCCLHKELRIFACLLNILLCSLLEVMMLLLCWIVMFLSSSLFQN